MRFGGLANLGSRGAQRRYARVHQREPQRRQQRERYHAGVARRKLGTVVVVQQRLIRPRRMGMVVRVPLQMHQKAVAQEIVGIPGMALVVAALTGVSLAAREWDHRTAFQIVFWAKVTLFLCLLLASYFHNFVLGPRLQAEIREERDPVTKPRLIVVGWISYSLTLSLPILGVALQRLVS